MRMRLLIVLLILPLLGIQDADEKIPVTIEDTPSSDVRFEAVHVYLDSGDSPLAAYQLVIAATTDDVRIVGIEGGAHAAFTDPPYYDPIAMQRDHVIIADFSLATAERLPSGRVRIATIHVQITGDDEPQFEATVQVAATVDGQAIEAGIDYTRGADG